MKKSGIILVNVLIMVSILVFVHFYLDDGNHRVYQENVSSFHSMTVAMEKVTENYLDGEQHVCDVWAMHILSADLTLEEATEFIRHTHVSTGTSAHLIYADTPDMSGLSTRPKAGTEADYAVSYQGLDLFTADPGDVRPGQSAHITRSYINPMNGMECIGFYNALSFRDPDSGLHRPGFLIRVVPVAELEDKWVFPQEEYQNAEFSMIDAQGDYIIRSHSFEGSNFMEFFRSCNPGEMLPLQAMEKNGSITMQDAQHQSCLIAYAPVRSTDGWALLGYLPVADIARQRTDWLLIGMISAALLLMFAFDGIYMLRINQKLQSTAEEARNARSAAEQAQAKAEQAQAEAEQASRAKTDFLSTMSHDIRTPMNAIIGLTTLTEKNLGDPESVRENLRKINLASNHLLTLINDILDISKVESGKLTLSPSSFSIVETTANLVNLSQPMVREKNIDFSFHVNRMEREYLYADQLRLNQIFINILSNAIKYTEPGGRVRVDLSEHDSGTEGTVRLTYIVEDTGIGMTEEFMEKMYQPFSRQTDSRVNTIQGTGLGLAITHQMVTLMNGTIDCESAPGKGTKFTVTLDVPIADRQLEDMHLEPVDILVVDDDEVLLETARDALNSLGASTDVADSAELAMDMMRARHASGKDYGVVILDWRMPARDGISLSRDIRREIGHDVPILLISAYDWSDIEEEARKAGANGFVSKPLFRSTLYEKISQLLGVEKHVVIQEDDHSDLAGMHILVAEDNEINWEIIQALMEMYGVKCDHAENGRICVEKMKNATPGQYDLIFMDIQMPEMNGLDATRAIRSLPDPWASSLPILAMTADAFSENVAECLAAGMNGHIAKPIDIKLVLREIHRLRDMRTA